MGKAFRERYFWSRKVSTCRRIARAVPQSQTRSFLHTLKSKQATSLDTFTPYSSDKTPTLQIALGIDVVNGNAIPAEGLEAL